MNELINNIKHLIETAEKFRNSYFWTSPSSAGMRRSYEKQNSVPMIEWDEGGNHYTAEYNVSCSCKNIYASGIYTKNGNKTTLTTIKNSLKRLEA